MTEQQSSGGDSLFENAPYEYGAIVPAGAVVFTAGACPLDSEGSVVGLGDHVEQAGVAFDNLTLALQRPHRIVYTFGKGRRLKSETFGNRHLPRLVIVRPKEGVRDGSVRVRP